MSGQRVIALCLWENYFSVFWKVQLSKRNSHYPNVILGKNNCINNLHSEMKALGKLRISICITESSCFACCGQHIFHWVQDYTFLFGCYNFHSLCESRDVGTGNIFIILTVTFVILFFKISRVFWLVYLDFLNLRTCFGKQSHQLTQSRGFVEQIHINLPHLSDLVKLSADSNR